MTRLMTSRVGLSHDDQLEAAVETFCETSRNVPLALEPSAEMATMQTTMIRASMTAYSTAVGPSSRLRKLTKLRVIVDIELTPVMV